MFFELLNFSRPKMNIIDHTDTEERYKILD